MFVLGMQSRRIEYQSLCGSEVTIKIKQLEIEGARARVLSHGASLSTQHVRLSGVRLCRPDSLELAA